MLEELEHDIQESIKQPDLLPYIKVKIKNILENCRSPLDYAAVFVFETYCRNEYQSKKQMKKKKALKPSFVITDTPEKFEENMNNRFMNLYKNSRKIYNVFKKAQPFNGNPWLKHLTDLVNENKHRNLTKQEKNVATQINYYKDENGNTFVNVFSDHNGIVIDGVPIGQKILEALSRNQPVDATIWVEYIFTDLKLSVIDTLFNIYNGSLSIINELEKVFEGK